MKRFGFALLLAVLATQDPDPHGWIVNEPLFLYAAAYRLQSGQPPPECNADQPWMCGSVEIGCNRTGVQPGGDTATEFYACKCQHTCDRKGSPDDETQGRIWDRKCYTRCSTKHCHCPTRCET